MNLLTHTRLTTYRTCPRKHYLRFELGLTPQETSMALNIGRLFHMVMDARQKGEEPDFTGANSYDLAAVAAMENVYHEYHDPLNMVQTELPFRLPLVHQKTQRPSHVWQWAGVVDGIAWLDNGLMALVERKTTTKDITPGSDYWLAIMHDQQASDYVEAARRMGWPVQTILYDVIRRPLSRPQLATPSEKRKYKKDGTLYANQREFDETPLGFGIRYAELMRSDPEKHFQRIEIPRLESELADATEDRWMFQRMIRRSQLNNEWPRNPGSCLSPYKCQFLSICGRNDLETHTPNGFIRLDNPHPELPEEIT